MSGNHNQSLETALKIVDAAADAGVHAIKLQTYTADTMTIDVDRPDFKISEKESLWKGETLYSLYQKAHTPWDWHQPLFDRARERGVMAFSTPFDASAVDFLESFDVPLYKIASFENTDLKLIKKVAETGKPVIISTGMATLAEIDETVRTLREAGCDNFILLKCTSSYPATANNSNLLTIPHMRNLFGCEVGLSDHTLGIGAAVASVALGARVIEKHFVLDRKAGGVDSVFSLEPHEMKALVDESKTAFEALGRISYGPLEAELGSRRFRRSLYFVKDLEAGATITSDCLRAIRPGYGLPVKYYDLLIGKKVNKSIAKGTAASFDIWN